METGESPTESSLLTLEFCFLIIFKGEDHARSITQALSGGPCKSECNQAEKKRKKNQKMELFIYLNDNWKSEFWRAIKTEKNKLIKLTWTSFFVDYTSNKI